jgi:hypothetical protein
MISEVVTMESFMSVVEAAQRMIADGKGPLPVVEGARVVDRPTDLISGVVAAGRDPKSVRIGGVLCLPAPRAGRDARDTPAAASWSAADPGRYVKGASGQ